MHDSIPEHAIAIVGLAGRWPGAPNIDRFWRNLSGAVESVSFFTDEELEASGIDTSTLPPNYVKARAILETPEWFDAPFFGYTPREAEVMDPQQRVFLEVAWEALEHAGYDTEQYRGTIGVFAGMANNTYFRSNLQSHPELVEMARAFATMIANEKDYLTTRTSYKLNLTGPSINVNTACSTSLVAVCQACQSLLTYQCDMALAGGVAIRFPQRRGSLYQEGGMTSADGHCRAFDASATGMVSGEGAGIVVLKRLADALAEGDTVAAVIRGFAVNNDGAHKVGYTAPSVGGQAEVIAMAMAMADIEPESVTYVEAHGTATPLGDPIEIAGLTQAFRARTDARGFCAIGSVKTNIGHLDAAAGAAGLIKTVLALQHRRLPPSLHFVRANPNIDFAHSPFFVNARLAEWLPGTTPRRAGVSSFGIGGTNAHVVLEEAPKQQSGAGTWPDQLLVISAKSATALDRSCDNLAAHLQGHPDSNLADTAFTLQVGRRAFSHRRAVVCRDAAEAATELQRRCALDRRNPHLFELGRRWLEGESVDWSALHQGARRRRMPLPTYPFERERFWVEPIRAARGRAPGPASSAFASSSRQWTEQLRSLFAELSAIPTEDLSVTAGFFDLGFDSLLLTQASLAIETRFGVTIPFRKLQAELASIDRLADFLNAARPADRAAATSPRPQETPAFGPYRPADSVASEPLTPELAAHVSSLAARYTQRTARSRALTQAHRVHFADPRAAAGFRPQWKEMVYPLVVERSSGCRLWDVDGHEYIDLTMGFGVNLFGHSPDFVTRAVEGQLRRGIEIGPQSPLAGDVAAQICRLTGADRATFCNTGSEAVLAALRIARTVTNRDKVAIFSGSYHGIFDEVLVRPATGGRTRPSPIAPGIVAAMVANVIVLDYGDPRSLDVIREHAHELAAVLVEPVQSRNPNLQPAQFLKELRVLTRERGVALIFDEIITGFRCHLGGAQAHFGVPADIATYGKVLGGGMPLGVVAGQARFMDALDGGQWQYGDSSAPHAGATYFAGTFVRHPLAIAAAQAVLTRLEHEGPGLQRVLNERTGALAESIRRQLDRAGFPLNVGRFASLIYLKAVGRDPRASLLFYHLREKGIHLWEGRPAFLSTAHTDEDIAAIESAFAASITELSPPASVGYAVAPLTPAQTDLWIATQMSEDASRSYNLSCLLSMHGSLDVDALRSAIQHVIERHEALRTTFDSDGTRQRIWDRMTLTAPLLDFCEFQPEQAQGRLAETVERDAHESFDLENGPLLRAQIVKLGDQRHVLLLTVHHLVVDGWSLGVLLDEVGRIYSARRMGRVPDLPPPLPSRIFTQQMPTQEDATIRDYWVRQFQPAPAPLDLPFDRPRPAIKTYRAATESILIDGSETTALRAAGGRDHATLFHLLLASFTLLLHRLSGVGDLVVGIPSAGQLTGSGLTIRGSRSLIGDYVNLLPIRVDCRNDLTFSAYVRSVKEKVLSAYENQNFTFGDLVHVLKPPRDPSRVPLVSVAFNLDRGITGLGMEGLETEVVSPPKAFEYFDLRLNVTEQQDELRAACTFNTDLFDAETICRWLEHWRFLLEHVARGGGDRLSDMPLVTSGELRRLLAIGNGEEVAVPDGCVHHWFENQARLRPRAIAVECEGQRLSYGELNSLANRLAAHLRDRGLARGRMAALLVERSPLMLVGLLAILKAGGAYVPLDPSYPESRLRFMLEDSGADILVTQAPLRERLQVLAPTVVDVDAMLAVSTAEWPDDMGQATSDDLAYVIYTSGSTGRPKGVAVGHRALANVVHAMRLEIGFGDRDVLLAVTTLSFDIAALELLLPLVAGARLVVAPSQTAADGRLVLEAMKATRATVMQATPVAWSMAIDAGWQGDPPLLVLCGGETMSPALARQLCERSDRVWNLYGPTEATIWSTAHRVDREEPDVPIGRPLANTQVRILDPYLRPVPANVPGELYVGGAGVAAGYWKRGDLTAERFLSMQFDGEPSTRFFRTGDMARLGLDGRLRYLARADDQIKLRGHRIEPGEIEAVLAGHAQVREAKVVLREDVPGDRRLVAYLVMREPGFAPADLRAFLRQQMPDYMVPAAFVLLPALPLTPNGKVDGKALPVPQYENSAPVHDPPSTPIEAAIAKLWSEVLNVQRVGINDNFFELGGDSLLAMQIIIRIKQRLSIDLSVRQFFDTLTVNGLARAVSERPGMDKHQRSAPP